MSLGPTIPRPGILGNRANMAETREAASNGGSGGGCSGGSCAVGGGRRGFGRKARTRPYGIQSALSVAGPITFQTTSIPVKIPAGSKLRLTGTVGALAAAITSVSVDGTQLNLGPGGLAARVIDPEAMQGVPQDFILPAINTSLVVVTTTTNVGVPMTLYLDNVPLSVINGGCAVDDNGADQD